MQLNGTEFEGRYERQDLECAIKGAVTSQGRENIDFALLALNRYLGVDLTAIHGADAARHIMPEHGQALCVVARERFADYEIAEPILWRLNDAAQRAAIVAAIPGMDDARLLKALEVPSVIPSLAPTDAHAREFRIILADTANAAFEGSAPDRGLGFVSPLPPDAQPQPTPP